MPDGTIGFRAWGTLTKADYTDALLPPLLELLGRDQKVRLLFQLGPDFDELEPGAIWEDAKFGVRLAIPHLSAWERTAVVSDVPWIHRAIATFGWMQPGELRVFPLDEAEEAKAWLGR